MRGVRKTMLISTRFIRRAWPALALCGLAAFSPHGGAAEVAPFAQAGVAFVEKNCTACHGEKKQKANLALHKVRDDLALLRARKQCWRW